MKLCIYRQKLLPVKMSEKYVHCVFSIWCLIVISLKDRQKFDWHAEVPQTSMHPAYSLGYIPTSSFFLRKYEHRIR